MKIICNGEEQEVRSDITLVELMRELDLNPNTVVAECNGVIVKKGDYETLVLPENAKLELIRFVGGG